MEENEMEEGEANNYYQEENDESNIDPDVHLSYIDEKIEVCLGHLKKAFEGGVSADNLGPKFGGYGSFLPSYQRSPIVLSHPRTPQKIQNYNAPKSPNNLQSEDALENAKVASSVTHVMGLGPDRSTISAEQHPVYRAPAFVGEFTSAHKPVSINPNEKKTLKVRIKVGPGSMPARTNAEIYSGLGLDISPSSSFDDSATESGGLSLESHDAPDESPTSMIRIMTSFPVPGGVLLSPLSDSLLFLMKKEKLVGDNRCGLSYKSSQESSAPCVDESSLRGDRKVYTEKRKLVDKKSVDVNNKNVSDAGKDSFFLKKKIDALNSVPCNVKKVSPISKSKGVTDDLFQNSGRESGGLSIRAIKEEFVSGISKKEMFETIAGHSVDSSGKQNLKINMAHKCLEGGKATLLKGDLIEPRNFRRRKDGESQDLSMNKIDASKGGENMDVGGLVDPSTRKTSAAKHGIKVTLARRKSSDGGNLKLNGIVGKDVSAEEFPKRISKVASSSSGKEKANKTGEFPSKSKIENRRLHKDSGKPRERSTDLCGDAKVELPENIMDSLETPRYKAIDSVLHVEEKENPNITDKAKERSNVTRKVENLLSSEAYTKLNPIVTPLTGSEPVSYVPAVDSHLMDQWVGCDKCSKWRLIPYGMDPDSFPKTWHCGMLDWLPGMNRCDFSQEKTTTAFYALYQLPPVPVNQNVNNLPHEAVAGQHMNLTHSGDDSHGGFNVGKKKLQKGAPKAYQKDISNSTENSLKASMKSKNLHDVVQSPLESDPSNYLRSNDVKHPRVNRKRGEDQDELKVSKKRKSFDYGNEHWMNDHRREAAKRGPNSMNVIAKNMIVKDVKCDSKDRTIVSIKNSKGQVAVPVKDGGIAGKKRKVKEWQKSEIYPPESHPSTVPHFSDSSYFVKEETNESEQGKEKKARVSKLEVKELSLSKGVDKTAKRGRGTRIIISSSKSTLPLETKESIGGYLDKEQQLGQYVGESTASPRSLDGMEILKKDIGDIQNTVAPSSSSSKVSGSSKTRYDIQEVKGSPVASVSSSPLKIIRERRKAWPKDGATTIKFSAGGGSSLRCPGNEPHGGNFETERMEGVIPRSSLVSSGVHHQDRDGIHPLNGESIAQAIPSASNADDHNLVNSNRYNSTGSKVKKSKESLQSNNKIRSSKSAHGECDAKVFSPYPEQEQYQRKNLRFQMRMGSQNTSYNEEPRIEKSSFVEKCAVETSKVEKNRSSKKDPIGIPPTEGEIDDWPKFGGNEDSSEVKLNGANSKAGKCRPKQTSLQFHETDKAPSKFASERLTNHLGIATEKEKPLPCSGDKEESLAHLNQPVAEGNTLKISEGPAKLENYSKTHSRQSTTSGYLAKDLNATQIPVKKDPSSQAAANAIKEAKDLKHTADRLMKLGQELESAEIYFQACLKFLHGSSLLEHCNTESTKRGDMNYMIEMYSSTAKLWDYVAHAYEKLNVMAAAALAYKCTEVAYMKVIYSKNLSVNKDRHELQEALKMAPPGESPSSSSSGVDNLNNQVTLDKVALAKADGSQITGRHEIVAQNHPKFVRLLNFAENVNNAMEASRKSQNALALAAANAGAEVMSSAKSVIDFTFHDIDGLLRLVRLAMETISR